jgi:hypothetical protein
VTIRNRGDDVTMSRRRFAVLLCALVAVNAFLWLAQGGFALPRAMIDRFFGPRMIRAEVILQAPGGTVNDFRLDRGVIVSVAPGSIDLRERDGATVDIAVARRARVVGSPGVTSVAQLRPGLRVLVVHKANAPANLIQVEAGG